MRDCCTAGPARFLSIGHNASFFCYAIRFTLASCARLYRMNNMNKVPGTNGLDAFSQLGCEIPGQILLLTVLAILSMYQIALIGLWHIPVLSLTHLKYHP